MTGIPWRITPGDLDVKLGIEVREQSPERVVATMPVAGNTQSLGRLHGGATAALAEAIGSWAAMIHASTLGKVCVGVDLNITHHRGARSGVVTGTATALHRGRRMATYDIRVTGEDGALLATARISNLLVDPD
ncbi:MULTISPECIES: PaaI family thioesterase [Microbacterium]|uniref:PaaI family thioesterase n=1 Tax=Microbacterium wangchenii TaxID=2541726 RepID=A0ABX5SXY1_9MICO|nr:MULTISPECIES: PaaI family thioesterase [Microbacterium]MCK6067070.1 PaaI family thioesterase [Microbacterium sp. EYE_512]QBR89968.1 PaaI family thioesterase [Microbacterium wangchenii]TFV85182.1 PaaI family thioesterase [Microbacterium sp. dk485]TXK16436.1 PaaI family thioesterase [Microbacterium wangchenii]